MHFFIGLTFSPHFLQYKKIDSFRKRFDSKYRDISVLQMTLLPPFKVEREQKIDLSEMLECLEDELDSNLQGLEEVGTIEFNGIDFRMGRSGVLYLRPFLPIDLYHCQEKIHEVLVEYGATFKRNTVKYDSGHDLESKPKTFLPIGRAVNMGQLQDLIEIAKSEFSMPFFLQIRDIVLFEKSSGMWTPRKNLFTFEELPANLNLKQIGISPP